MTFSKSSSYYSYNDEQFFCVEFNLKTQTFLHIQTVRPVFHHLMFGYYGAFARDGHWYGLFGGLGSD